MKNMNIENIAKVLRIKHIYNNIYFRYGRNYISGCSLPRKRNGRVLRSHFKNCQLHSDCSNARFINCIFEECGDNDIHYLSQVSGGNGIWLMKHGGLYIVTTPLIIKNNCYMFEDWAVCNIPLYTYYNGEKSYISVYEAIAAQLI